MKIHSMLGAVALVLVAGGFASAADWGDLTIQFKLGGTAPTPKSIKADKDAEVCGKHKLVEEKLTVGPSGGIADIFVYVRTEKVAIHPDYDKVAGTEVVLDNKGCRFEPHAAFVWSKQTLLLKNSDPIGHNTKIEFLNNPPINPILPANGTLKQTVKKEERLPAGVSCSIHPWMQAKLLVRENPYGGVTDSEGKVTLKNLPAGKLKFTIWHEGTGYVTEVKDKGGKDVKWPRTGVDFTIKAGANDMGVYTIDLGKFK